MKNSRLELVRAAKTARVVMYADAVIVLGLCVQLLTSRLEHGQPGLLRTFSVIGISLMPLGLLAVAIYAARQLRSAVVAAAHLCPSCGYDRAGAALDQPCSECGSLPLPGTPS
jgi:hypothetical protein